MPILGGAAPTKVVYDTTISPYEYGPLVLGLGDYPQEAARIAQNTATMQAAMDGAIARKLPLLLPPGLILVNTLHVRGALDLQGAAMGGGSDPSTLVMATAASPCVFRYDMAATPFHGGTMRRIAVTALAGHGLWKTGGQRPAYVEFEDCNLTGTGIASSGVYIQGPVSEWTFTRCKLQGTFAGFQVLHQQGDGGTVDSMRFIDTKLGGKHFVHAVAAQTNGFIFDHAFGNTAGQGHAWYFDGPFNGVFDTCYADEDMFRDDTARLITTASITSGSNIATLATITGTQYGDALPPTGLNLQVGEQLSIAGAGSIGSLLVGTVTAINGLAITLNVQAGTTVTGAYCTNSRFDVVHFKSSGSFTFRNCGFRSGSGSNARFGVYNAGGSRFEGGVCEPAWDHLGQASVVGSPMQILTGPISPGQTATYRLKADGAAIGSLIPSSPGGDAAVTLQPGGPNYTAPWGKFAVYKRDPGGDGVARLTVDADGHLAAYGSLKPGTVTSLPTASVTHRGRLLRVEGGSGVADALYVCRKDAGGTYSWAQIA